MSSACRGYTTASDSVMVTIAVFSLSPGGVPCRAVLVFQDQMALVPFSSRRSKASGSPSSLDGLLGNVSILERLDELRRRLVHSALAVCVGTRCVLAATEPYYPRIQPSDHGGWKTVRSHAANG